VGEQTPKYSYSKEHTVHQAWSFSIQGGLRHQLQFWELKGKGRETSIMGMETTCDNSEFYNDENDYE